MKEYRHSIRVGAAAIACALVMRLWAADIPGRLSRREKANTEQTETGQDARFSSPLQEFVPVFAPESAIPMLPEKPALPFYEVLPEFQSTCGKHPELEPLLKQPLSWDLRDGAPAVLILSTHATESYTKSGESYEESAAWRTLDPAYNMLSIGDRIQTLLEEAGIRVIRDLSLHDYPSYNGSYANARKSMAAILDENPSIRLVLDLHRDAAEAPGGGQMRPLAAGRARLMAVMGAGFENFQENLSLALKLCAQLERQVPGITRPIQLRSAKFNQDLCPGALLIEVGAAGNTRQEALLAAEELAKAIIALANGTGEAEEGGK